MQHKLLIYIIWQVSVTPFVFCEDLHFKAFINEVEVLVLNTTGEALRMTTIIYQNISKNMTPQLREATEALMENYTTMVNQSLQSPDNYEAKRNLLRHFRINNWKLEKLRLKLSPQLPKFQFEVISKEFYFSGQNQTIFDNLYLNFMQKFQKASQDLWQTLSEDVVENQPELLEILDEISKEKNLAEKDQLFDEFIEMFLFKSDKDRLETRELE